MYMWYHVISCWKKNNVISNQFWSSFAVDVFFFRICSFQTSHGFLSQGVNNPAGVGIQEGMYLPKTNISPAQLPSQKENSLSNTTFPGASC